MGRVGGGGCLNKTGHNGKVKLNDGDMQVNYLVFFGHCLKFSNMKTVYILAWDIKYTHVTDSEQKFRFLNASVMAKILGKASPPSSTVSNF